MAELTVRTRGNAEAKGKPRVYFTSHGEDAERWREALLADLFAAADVAVYYRDTDTACDEDDLRSMNLFVVPVTFRLLREESGARSEIAFAEPEYLYFTTEGEILENWNSNPGYQHEQD
jgi:hypothetical protein